MRRIPVFIAFALIALPAPAEKNRAPAASVFRDPVIPHFAAGGGQWRTTFVFHNPSDTREKFFLGFFGADGLPIEAPVSGGMYSAAPVELPPYSTYKLVTDLRPDLSPVSGFALLLTPPDCEGCRFYFSTVQTILALYDPEQEKLLCETAIPQESAYDSRLVLVYDQEGPGVWVALMNPGAETRTVAVSVYDAENRLLRSEEFPLEPLARQTFVLGERYPETADKVGYMKFSAGGPGGIAGVALRFSPNGTFTAIPLIAADD